jgi:hypothetical protein
MLGSNGDSRWVRLYLNYAPITAFHVPTESGPRMQFGWTCLAAERKKGSRQRFVTHALIRLSRG